MFNPNPVRKWFQFALLAALLLGVLLSPDTSQAAPLGPELNLPLPNIIVTTTAIADDPSDGKCDLWEAMQAVFQANNGLSLTYHECTAKLNAQNIIGFSVIGGTITVPAAGPRTDLPFVHGDTVIVGPITIAGGGSAADTHLLRTAPGATLTVIGVVIKGGHTSGAGPAIYSDNGAAINVIGSFLINNVADTDGGAIYSNGDLNVMGTSFANNQAKGLSGNGAGGAIFVSGIGSFKSEASTFTANQALSGGAIYLDKSGGDSSISDSIFTANTVSGNVNSYGGGAVVYLNSNGTLDINRSAFNGNFSTQGEGGAIVNRINSVLHITNTLFDANSAGDPTHPHNGGAIYNVGVISITKSTLVANVAQGGSGGAFENDSGGTATIGNSTFNSNIADSLGGAIYTTANNTMAIRNSTFASNNANGQGGIFYLGGTAQIGNTILDGSTTVKANCVGNPLTSLGRNIDTGTSCGLNGSGDMSSTNPLLGALGFHGGALPVLTTQQPSYTSPAVDQGNAAICADPSVNNEDETGTKRPKDANNTGNQACDIGAIELAARKPAFDAVPMPPGPINFGSVQANHTLTTSFDIHNSGNYLLTVSSPSLGDNTHYGVVTAFPVAVDVNATKTIVLSCMPTSAGSLTTTLSFSTTDSDKPTVSYSLLCNGTAAPAPAFVSVPAAPEPLEFGDVTIGQVSTHSITIQNNGTANLNITPTSFLSDSSNFENNLTAQMIVSPGGSKQISVNCHPNRVGALAGKLTVQTNDDSQSSASYQLNCNGVPPQTTYLVNSENLKYPWFPSDFNSQFGVATSPDGLNAYVNGNMTGGGEVVVLKHLDSGLLAGDYLPTTVVTNENLSNPHEMKVSPDGQYVLVTGGPNNALLEYHRDGGNGDLTLGLSYSGTTSTIANGFLNNPFGVAFSPDSQFVYVTNSNGNSISIFKHIGSAFFYSGLVTTTTSATHPLTDPTGIVVSPDGENVYVSVHTTTPSTGTLAVYRRNTTTGDLTPIQTRYQGDNQDNPLCSICFPVNGLASTYQLAISPDGGNIYVTSWYNHAVANFQRDPATGLLHYSGAVTNTNIGGSGLTNAFGIAVSPDSKHVYATSNGDNSLVMFDREALNGNLTFHEKYQRDSVSGFPALNGAFQTAVSSDGHYVFAVGQFDKAVAIFRIANPVPVLFSLEPASVAQGSAQFTLVVKGSGFVTGAYVSWDSYNPSSMFINSSEMRATIPASYITSAGTHTIKVTNPVPGGGVSFNTLTFQVLAPSAPPVPSIDHIVPAGVKAGAAGIQVDVYGSNFNAQGLTITANGSGAISSFIDSTHVRIVAFNANTFAQPGTVNIQVNNNGVQSNIVGLDVAAPGQNPVPSITVVNPGWVWSLGAGSPDLVLTITGNNFVDGAIVQWNGDNRPTSFINSTTLQATIYGTDQLSPANNSITVVSPAPGGGASNTLTFIVRPLNRRFIPIIKR